MGFPWKAAGMSAGLSALFLVVYGACNIITSTRADVGALYQEWERALPFVPAFILPYMSIDLFFIGAPFLAKTDRERRALAKRIAAVILIAGVCFLLTPLRFAFERPHAQGVLGVIFNHFRTLDLPFNQYPSLHVALLVVLWDLYHRHTSGVVRWGLAAWFALIGVSPLLTYQHHAIDLVGGFALGVLCLHMLGEMPLRRMGEAQVRMAAYYGAAAIGLMALAFAWAPWTLVLLWPAAALAVVAGGYLGLGARVYRKEQGRLAWTTWVLLWPVLLGQRASLAYYARQCRAFDQVAEGLWIGRRLSSREAEELQAHGVAAVVDLTAEFTETAALRGLAYLQVPVLDLTAPRREQIDEAVAFMRQHAARGGVYVHCKIGYSRTAAVAGAYLLATGRAGSAEEAIALLRRARPGMIVRPEAEAALRAYEHRHGGTAAAVAADPA